MNEWMNVWVSKCGVCVEQYWGKKTKYSEKSLSLYLLIQHKSHMAWPGIEPGTLLEAGS